MRSSDHRSLARAAMAFVAFVAFVANDVHAQTAPAGPPAVTNGFALERLHRSAPGAGWFVLDALDMHGGLGGAASLTVGYAKNPLVVGGVPVVSSEALAALGFAVTYGRLRAYVDFDAPFGLGGNDTVAGGYRLQGPHVDLGVKPDTVADPRLGVDARLLGDHDSAFRLGASAQLYFPSGDRTDTNVEPDARANYVSDGSYRAIGRLLAAGDVGVSGTLSFTYAAMLGVHVRPLDDAPIPGYPRGSELLFGVAAGPTLDWRDVTLTVGPEVWGETAFRAFLGGATTGVEGMLSGRLGLALAGSTMLRTKLGLGAGLDADFGAPAWRAVVGVELSGFARPEASGPPHPEFGVAAPPR